MVVVRADQSEHSLDVRLYFSRRKNCLDFDF